MAKINPIQLQKFLKGLEYPASKQELVDHARQHGADENVLTTLRELPDDHYDSPVAISEAVSDMD